MIRIKSPMKHLYEEKNLPADVCRSLNLILLGNICGGIFGLVGQASTSAMVGLATFLGADAMMLGLINAIPQMACIFQIPCSMLINKTGKRKKLMVFSGVPARFCWVLIGMTPLMFPNDPQLALITLLLLLLVSSIAICMPSVAWFSWLSDLAPAEIRSRWISRKETMAALCSFVCGLGFAALLDNIEGSIKYPIVFLIAGLIGMFDISCFYFVKEVPLSGDRSAPVSEAFKRIFHDKQFLKFIIMWTFWCFTSNMFSPYLTPYSMNEMGLSFMDIMLFGTMVCSISTAIAMPKWGVLLTKVQSRKIMMISCIGTCLTPLFYLFAVPGSIWPTLLYNLFGAILWSGCNLCAAHMQLEYSASDIRPMYLALFNCITALAGTTLGSLAGGFILNQFGNANIHFLSMDRYQILFTGSSILRLASTLILVPGLIHTVKKA